MWVSVVVLAVAVRWPPIETPTEKLHTASVLEVSEQVSRRVTAVPS
jgi:hypothetical protein